jgi:hypothetical protein
MVAIRFSAYGKDFGCCPTMTTFLTEPTENATQHNTGRGNPALTGFGI